MDANPSPPNPLRQRSQAAGFTLVELGIVLAVIAIVGCIATPSLRTFLDMRRLRGVSETLAADLRFVRSEAAARNEALRWSLRPSADGPCYVIHTGAANLCDCLNADGPARCNGGARQLRTVRLPALERVGLQANVASMVYDPAHGTTTPTGTLRVTGASNRAVHLVVNLMGRVRSCSPQGAVAGYKPC